MNLITRDIELAVKELKQGNLVAIPTETVYGLAADFRQENAVKKVFALKNRPLHHPLIVHIANASFLSAIAHSIPDYVEPLIHAFWPGPLTLILPKKSSVSDLITGGQESVAVRCPNHPLTQSLLEKLNSAVVAPSANPFGQLSPTTAHHVDAHFPDAHLTILDGGRSSVGIESTIVDARLKNEWRILRHGMISAAQIEHTIALPIALEKNITVRAPGVLKTHYQPRTPLFIFRNSQELAQLKKRYADQLYVISFTLTEPLPPHIQHYTMPAQPRPAAYELYYQLTQADNAGLRAIAIEMPPSENQWAGICDRILKASTDWS
ncbi:MAG: threonylcarbamoyl-AMP synthase [Legionellales bacterium]|nr:threonylcarbamoyl-AMP synthase [Legionellales bacterium]